MTDVLNHFIWGALVMGCAIVGLFFLRFWRTTRDRLFLFFALAFWTFAIHWLTMLLVPGHEETRHWHYVVRLVAFLLLGIGIVDKNRSRR